VTPDRSDRAELDATAAAAAGCTNCELYRRATQTVFGTGPVGATYLLVGEQPGDKEDLAGEPFVGPAGALLHRALAGAGIDLSDVYLTNAVKHFKWERSGKVRLHKQPNAAEIRACHPWLERELALVRPEVVVLLGATALRAFFGSKARVTELRGQWLDWPHEPRVTATIHPSAALRAGPDRERVYAGLVADLTVARRGRRHRARSSRGL
jgi:DNA polymerase